jgi:hypothetical protein
MSSTAKSLAYATLTIVEITFVALIVLSFAVIAIVNCFAARKRSRPLENATVLCLVNSTIHHEPR